MLKKSFFLFLSIIVALNSSAQIKSYSFYIIDENTLEAIPFVSIFSAKNRTAYQSDKNGLVSLFESDIKTSYTTYHIAYERQEINLSALKDSLFLEMKAYELPVVNLKQMTPEEVVWKAIQSIAKNYPSSKHYLDGTYFQIHKENQRYVRYIEAKVSVEKLGYATKIQMPQEEKFTILQLRKSFNYEKNGDQHGDHLVDLFAENPLQYLEKNMLNKTNFPIYEWQFSKITEEEYQLTFQNKPWGNQRNLIGELVVNKSDFAILSITLIELPNVNFNYENKSNWHFVNGWYEINYKQNGEKYYLDKNKKWYHHLVKNEYNPLEVQFEVEEQFIWQTTASSTEIRTAKYSKLSNLYSLQLPYDSLEWEDNDYLETVRHDLEVKYTLNHQFNTP